MKTGPALERLALFLMERIRLEVQAESKFQDATARIDGSGRIAVSLGDLTEVSADVVGRLEVHQIEAVQALSTKFEVCAFGDLRRLDGTEVIESPDWQAYEAAVTNGPGGCRADVLGFGVERCGSETTLSERSLGVVDDAVRQELHDADTVGLGTFVHPDQRLELLGVHIVQNDTI